MADVNATSGSSDAARMSATASSASTRLPAHQPQLPWPFLMLLSRGVTSRPQFRHWLRHGVITFTYGSRGSRPTALQSAIASASGQRCLSLCASRRHLGQPPQPCLMLLYRGLTSSPQAKQRHRHCFPAPGTAPAVPVHVLFDHEASDDFMLRPLTTFGLPPSAPLAPVMSTSDIGVSRIHYLTAGQTAALPRRL